MTTPSHLIAIVIGLGLMGALLTRLTGRRRAWTGWLALGLTAVTSLLGAAAAVRVLLEGPGPAVVLCQWPGAQVALRLVVDGLSAVFVLLIAVVAFVVALYAPRYLEHPCYRGCSAGKYHSNFLLFLAALYGLVTTTDMIWFFFIFWQLMTLPGYTLIRLEEGQAEHVRAARRYLWMMQVACVLTLVGAGLLLQGAVRTPAGEDLVATDFDAVSHHLPRLLAEQPWRIAVAFAMLLFGFGIKVGMWPFGPVWLPDAHPAAPAPVSAMLSGIMIKTGIYGILRCFIWLIPPDARELFPFGAWGLVIALFGTVSLFVGTARALLQDRTKRLLAWSTIGQGGYILLAIGACVALLGVDTPAATALAGLALGAALFHTFNHALFKSVLFLVAGALFLRTGTQDLNRMGGWLRRMPWTAAAALVAGLAIAGAPLTNGFASKWCLFVVTFQSGPHLPWLPWLGAVGVLTSALTLAVVVKFFGAAFLGRTPGGLTEDTRLGSAELPWAQRTALLIPAVLCVGLGLVPALGLSLAQRALMTSQHGLGAVLSDAFVAPGTAMGGLAWGTGTAVMAPFLLLGLLAVAMGLGLLLVRQAGAGRRTAVPWLCGYGSEAVCRYPARDYFGALKPWLARLTGRHRRPTRPGQAAPVGGPMVDAAPGMMNRGAPMDA